VEVKKDERPAPRETQQSMLEPPPPAGGVKGATPAAVVKVKDEKVAVETLPRVARRHRDLQLASAPPSRRQGDSNAETMMGAQGSGLTLEALSTRAGTSSLVESARLLTKEQLVYALRLTGSKLRDVRQRAQKAEARP
jgi:hypothetical protein